MKTMKMFMPFVLLISLFFGGCKGKEKKNAERDRTGMQWNVNILIDLSNRIDTNRNKFLPTPMERDLAIIQTVIRLFKEHVQMPGKGTFFTQDKLRIFFHPLPKIAGIEQIAKHLQVDFEPMDPRDKKDLFRTMEERIMQNIRTVYEETLKNGKYEGSDLWGFIKEDVDKKCMEKDSAYRNILIILTDGYMYWKHDLRRQGNRYNYIERGEAHLTRFRRNGALEKEFDEKDYGFMVPRRDLNRLEVMILEMDYPEKHPQDYDTLRKYWSKWLTEMGVQRYLLLKTDMPVHTARQIERYLKEKI